MKSDLLALSRALVHTGLVLVFFASTHARADNRTDKEAGAIATCRTRLFGSRLEWLATIEPLTVEPVAAQRDFG